MTTVAIIVPYAHLRLPAGLQKLGFVLRGVREGRVEFQQAAPPVSVRITDTPRQKMAVEAKQSVARMNILRRPIFSFRDGRFSESQVEEPQLMNVPVMSSHEVAVNIANGFLPVHSYASPAPGDDALANERARLRNQPVVLAAADQPNDRPHARTIYFATNRKIVAPNDRTPARFGNVVGDLTFGSCLVNIPLENHERGNLETPSWWNSYDPERYFKVELVNGLTRSAWKELLRGRLGSDRNDALLFVHGYNNSFEFATLRLAQVVHDIGFTGLPMLFSWPSQGRLQEYGTDASRAKESVASLASVLKDLATERRGLAADKRGRIHLVAHSMGNRVLLGALEMLAKELPADERPFGHLIMAAPDVSVADFQRLLPDVLTTADAGTVYSCREDKALSMSHTLNSEPRAGSGAVFCIERLSNINADKVNTSLLGHDYFASHDLLLIDMQLLLRGVAPSDRVTIVPIKSQSEIRCGRWMFP